MHLQACNSQCQDKHCLTHTSLWSSVPRDPDAAGPGGDAAVPLLLKAAPTPGTAPPTAAAAPPAPKPLPAPAALPSGDASPPAAAAPRGVVGALCEYCRCCCWLPAMGLEGGEGRGVCPVRHMWCSVCGGSCLPYSLDTMRPIAAEEKSSGSCRT